MGLGLVLAASGCGSSSTGSGVTARRLQDAALLAQNDRTRCPLDLEVAKAIGGRVQPVTGDAAAAGTPIGKAPAGSSLVSLGGAAYRCGYLVGGQPVSLVVVVVPKGQEPVGAADGLSTPLQEAGLDQGAAQGLVQALQGAKAGRGVPSGSAAGATSTLPGGGAAAVALVGSQGGPAAKDLAEATRKMAATLKG